MESMTKQILNRIGEENLYLYDGGGYFYFEYDDETYAIYVNDLDDLTLDQWVESGKHFVKNLKKV